MFKKKAPIPGEINPEKKKDKTEGQKRRRKEYIQRKREEAWNARPQLTILKLKERSSDSRKPIKKNRE